MTRLLEDVVELAAPRSRVWAVIDDPLALRRILPGCEELTAEAPGRYRATMRTRLQFVSLRLTGTAAILDVQRPDHLRLDITGRPVGLVGALAVSVPIDLLEPRPGATRARYTVDLQLSGRLAAFGRPILRSAVSSQVRELVANLERELQGTGSAADVQGAEGDPG